jgi:hypothetical protein
MNDLDRRIAARLAPLRKAPVPDVPFLRPVRPEIRRAPVALLAAAGMLVALVGILHLYPSRSSPSAELLAGRITALEERIARLECGELRTLLSREVALLRRELELSQVKSD